MIKRQWYWNLPEIRVFFYEWVERCETGKAWALMCKKKNVLWKVHSAVWHLCFVCFLIFYFFLPSQTWMLGFSLDRLQKILCLVFCLFVAFLLFFFFFSLYAFIFPKKFWISFFPKSPILEFACWDSLESFPPYFAIVFTFLFIVEVTAFCSKFSFIKGEPAQFRFHSSEFSVSIMHSSLLS